MSNNMISLNNCHRSQKRNTVKSLFFRISVHTSPKNYMLQPLTMISYIYYLLLSYLNCK